jgi:hypothetical protein
MPERAFSYNGDILSNKMDEDASWQDEIRQPQRPVTALNPVQDAALAEASFIRGERRYTPVQKVGAVVLGISWCAPGIAGLVSAFLLMADAKHSSVVLLGLMPGLLIVSAGWLYFGGRMLWNVLRQGRPSR